MATKIDLAIVQGDTFSRIIRWETLPFIYKAITAITRAAPAVVTVPTHGLTEGWRAAIVSVLGMRQINAAHEPPRSSDFKRVTVVDANTVSFNTINSAEYDAYTSGGYLQFYTPVDITGFTARMKIKNRFGGTVLVSLVSPTNIVLDAAAKTITLTITDEDAAAFTWRKGVYDLELESPTGVTTKLYYGNITIGQEVTTP